MSEPTAEDQLDTANRAAFRKHFRNIIDRGVSDGEDSALVIGPSGSASPGLLDDLRANAIAYAQARQAKARR